MKRNSFNCKMLSYQYRPIVVPFVSSSIQTHAIFKEWSCELFVHQVTCKCKKCFLRPIKLSWAFNFFMELCVQCHARCQSLSCITLCITAGQPTWANGTPAVTHTTDLGQKGTHLERNKSCCSFSSYKTRIIIINNGTFLIILQYNYHCPSHCNTIK